MSDDKQDFREKVGKKLAIAREKKDLTIDGFVDEFNKAEEWRGLSIAKSTISQYENGKREPDLRTFAAICSHLNVSADTILGIPTPHAGPIAEMNLAQLEEVYLFQGMYQGLNEEGRKLLKDLVNFVYSKKRYQQDIEKEERGSEEKDLKEQDKYDEEQDKAKFEEEKEQFFNKLEQAKELDIIIPVKTFEEGYTQREKENEGYIILTERDYNDWLAGKEIDYPTRFHKALLQVKRSFASPTSPPQQMINKNLKPTVNFTWGDNESFEPINKKDDPTE